MDLKQIKLIIDLMKRSELTEFSIEEEGLKLKICRSATAPGSSAGARGSQAPFSTELGASAAAPLPASGVPLAMQVPNAALTAPAAGTPAAEEAGIVFVKCPMVGTFYRSGSPDAPPFVEVGTKIEANTPVCIVEAMKIMNEILAELRGTVVEVLVENGQPVEYGQKLFKVRQA